MREISVERVADAVAELAVAASCRLPENVRHALKEAQQREQSPLGRDTLGQIIENAAIAAQEDVPICQDTGLAVIFVTLGQDVHITGGSFEEAIHRGVARGYIDGYLRKSSVSEPLFERKNTGDNTPAVLHVRLVPGERLRIMLAAKGAGSENKSALKMLVPADGIEGVKRFVVDTVRAGGSSPCPPGIIGVGIGGNLELSALCAKRAAVRDVDSHNADVRYAALEDELLQRINALGLGPMGLGGTQTALKVNIEFCATHIASLPVAVNINCHAARHAEIEL